MFNLYSIIAQNPRQSKLLSGKGSLFTVFQCGLDKQFEDIWSHYNYIVYVLEGRKIWHTVHGSYDLQPGSLVFIRKGASIVEQFFKTEFCFYLFFIPDDFIFEVIRSKSHCSPVQHVQFKPVINIHNSEVILAFFHSLIPYFKQTPAPDPALVELKFKELILALTDDSRNRELTAYFQSILLEPQSMSLQRVMEDNYCFNLSLQEFARLCARSLSAFKRDFQEIYHMPPGKWLLEKRLEHARELLTSREITVSETAFECGFESSSHFIRVFRKRFGFSPGKAREQYRKNWTIESAI